MRMNREKDYISDCVFYVCVAAVLITMILVQYFTDVNKKEVETNEGNITRGYETSNER